MSENQLQPKQKKNPIEKKSFHQLWELFLPPHSPYSSYAINYKHPGNKRVEYVKFGSLVVLYHKSKNLHECTKKTCLILILKEWSIESFTNCKKKTNLTRKVTSIHPRF